MRKKGHNVKFLCGTDDYGSASEHMAMKRGITNEELCNEFRSKHKDIYKWFNLSFDIFGKTPTVTHTEMTQEIFTNLWNNGLLIEKITEHNFCEKCNRFLCDRFIYAECYHTNCKGIVKGDECGDCCKLIDMNKLTKKWCSICNSVPIKKETKHLYLKMEQFKLRLEKYFFPTKQDDEKYIKYMSPVASHITKVWLNKEFEDRCVTRDLVWGVSVPKLEGLSGYENKVIMPWLDAPIGYLSILKHNCDQRCENWKDWIGHNWIQFMAKDNVPFHTILFPITLLGSNYKEHENLHCGVTHLSSTEYLLFNKKKFAKSDNIGIFCDQAKELSEIFNIDEDYWRYYLVKIRPEFSDSNFDYATFCEIIKGELAQKIGNLVNRALVLAKKNYTEHKNIFKYDFNEHGILYDELKNIVLKYINAFDKFQYHDANILATKIAEIGNLWINETKLWNKCRELPNENEYLIGNVMFIIWLFAELIEPIMPTKSQKIKNHFCIRELDKEKITLFDTIISLLSTKKSGEILVDHANTILLFNQIKLENLENVIKNKYFM